MKKLLVVLDDETAKVLEKSPNMSQTIRDALAVYNEHISTDTMVKIKQAFEILLKSNRERQARDGELYEMVESMKNTLDELSNR